MATKTSLDTSFKSAGLGLPHLPIKSGTNSIRRAPLQNLDYNAGTLRRYQGVQVHISPQAPALGGIDPTLAKVQSTFQKLPLAHVPNPPSAQEVQGMYLHFKELTRLEPVAKPTVEDFGITLLARTLISAPNGQGFALLDRGQMGDKSFMKGSFRKLWHSVGLHDGVHYAIGITNIDKFAKKMFEKLFKTDPQAACARAVEDLEKEQNIKISIKQPQYIQQTVLSFKIRNLHCCITKYIPNGDVIDFFSAKGSSFHFPQRVAFCRKVAQGIENIHDSGIIHRDIKPDNILVEDNLDPLVGDFGFAARQDDHEALKRDSGSPRFVAPEIMRGTPATTKVDVWSAGVTMHSILLGKECLPWDKYPDKVKHKHVPQNENWQLGFNDTFQKEDAALKDLLQKMLTVDANKRITISEARKALEKIEAAVTPPSAHQEPVENKQQHNQASSTS